MKTKPDAPNSAKSREKPPGLRLRRRPVADLTGTQLEEIVGGHVCPTRAETCPRTCPDTCGAFAATCAYTCLWGEGCPTETCNRPGCEPETDYTNCGGGC